MNPTQLLSELRERYCDLTLDDRLNVKREMQYLSTVIDSQETLPPNPHGWYTVTKCMCCQCRAGGEKTCSFNCVCHDGDPLCALCSHPESEHAAHGDWCPNPESEDQLFNCSQKFVSDLQSLRKGA